MTPSLIKPYMASCTATLLEDVVGASPDGKVFP